MTSDYVIVGSGLTGTTIARALVDAGREVVVVERRSHPGGNVQDYTHPSGIRIHTYGPHYFRTSSEKIWSFVNRFASFYHYEAVLKSLVDGRYENWPIACSYIRRNVGRKWEPAFKGKPRNFEEASLAMMPRLAYEKFVKGYTEKQWGVPAHTLSSGLAKRFDLRKDDRPQLVRHKYQGLPSQGYSAFMENMLAGIPLLMNWDYLQQRHEIVARKKLIFTGPIDEFFDYQMGRLKYRGLRRTHAYLPEEDYFQPYGQVNNPDPDQGPSIRTLEWKHMMPPHYASRIQGTVVTRETPFDADDPDLFEYPFPDDANHRLYLKYRRKAEALPLLLVCGRLGDYRYYDMDQAIARGLTLAKKILSRR